MGLCFITWVQSQKQQNDFVYFQGKVFNITLIQVCASKTNAEEVEVEELYEDLEDILKLTLPKDAFFYYRGLECKSRKSRDTWSISQIWSWSTE